MGILDVYTSSLGDASTKQNVFRPGQSIFVYALHHIEPPMDSTFRVVFFIRRAFHLGFSRPPFLSLFTWITHPYVPRDFFDVLWKPADAVAVDGLYTTEAPAVISYYELPLIPANPAQPLDGAMLYNTDRRALFDGLVDGEFLQSAYPSFWSLVAMVTVRNPDMPDNVLQMEVSRPWYYYIRSH